MGMQVKLWEVFYNAEFAQCMEIESIHVLMHSIRHESYLELMPRNEVLWIPWAPNNSA